jgi:hypothetical protein
MTRIARISFGIFCIFLGLPSLVLPILPGWLFLAVGLLLLSIDLPFLDRLIRRLEQRFPSIKKPLERLRRYLGDSKEPKEKE